MKPNNQTAEKGFAVGIAGIILTVILIVLTHDAYPQSSIGLGLGKASDGRTTAKMYFVTKCGFGAYVCHYADAQEYIENSSSTGLQYSENPITSLGITARIHSLVTVYAGAGKWHTCKAYNDEKGYRYYEKSEGSCIEAGAIMEVWAVGRCSFHVDVSFNSTMQVNSMILCTVNIFEP